MKKQTLLRLIFKSIDFSAGITLLGVVGGTMLSFFLCFFLQKSITFPLRMVEIISQPAGGGYNTAISVSPSLLGVALSLFVVISAMAFAVLYMGNKQRPDNGVEKSL